MNAFASDVVSRVRKTLKQATARPTTTVHIITPLNSQHHTHLERAGHQDVDHDAPNLCRVAGLGLAAQLEEDDAR